VYIRAFISCTLGGRPDVSRLPLIERKTLLEPLVANKPGLQFNGHEMVTASSS
jgi:hypothetical protein